MKRVPRPPVVLLAPVVLGVALVGGQYVSSAGHPSEMARPLALVAAGSGLVTLVCWAILRRPLLAAWAASVAVAWLLGAQLTWCLGLMAGVAAFAFQAWRRMRGSPIRIPHAVVTAPIGALFALTLVQLVGGGVVAVSDFHLGPGRTAASVAAGRPSIYVLMLDGYPRGDELATIGVDNQPFLERLEDLGLTVYPGAEARFDRTELTLASTMMADATELEQYEGIDFPELWSTWRDLRRGYLVDVPTMDHMREAGYRLDYIATEVGHSEWRGWDVTHDSGQLTDTESRILQRSPLRSLLDEWVMDQHRARVDASLDTIGDLAREPRQKAVFAHLTPPHVPFLWGPDGEEAMPLPCWYERDCSLLTVYLDELEIGRGEYAERMAWQIDALNGRVIETLAGVVQADPEGVVVVMSDHGARFVEHSEESHHTLFAVRGAGDTFDRQPGPDGLFVRLLELPEVADAR